MRHAIGLIILFLIMGGCGRSLAHPTPIPPPQTVRSFSGVDLQPLPIAPDRLIKLRADLDSALADFKRSQSEDNFIWLGRRYAYLGDYNTAIDTFSRGLTKYPASYKLLRHRGHRYITTRQLDLAIADLSRAAALAASHPDEVEPDGAPNKLNQPRSTTQSNIYYHLGLAHYLKGDFAAALPAYQQCLAYARVNDDMLVATTYWLYLTLRRLNREPQAAAAIEPIRPKMDIIENTAYHRLLLMYRGELRTEELIPRTPSTGISAMAPIDDATTSYGLGAWHWCNGDHAAAVMLWQQTLATNNWTAFGYIAAEAELARSLGEQRHE